MRATTEVSGSAQERREAHQGYGPDGRLTGAAERAIHPDCPRLVPIAKLRGFRLCKGAWAGRRNPANVWKKWQAAARHDRDCVGGHAHDHRVVGPRWCRWLGGPCREPLAGRGEPLGDPCADGFSAAFELVPGALFVKRLLLIDQPPRRHASAHNTPLTMIVVVTSAPMSGKGRRGTRGVS